MRINKHDTQGTKPLLGKGELGYDDYAAGGDTGRVYIGTGTENISLAKKSEIDSHVNRIDNPHSVTKTQVGLGNVDNTADANKNVLSATKWTTARTITLSGDVAGSASMDGTANVSITTTVQPNSVALGTDTTGNYVASVTQGTGITVSGTAGEGWSPTIAITNVGTAGTYTKVTTNAQGQVTSGTTLSATDIPSLDASKITTGTLPVVQGGTGVTTSTGTGSVVLSTSPILTTPNIGVATGTSFNSITGLASVAPLVAGTAAVGTSTLTARQDHVHPAQTSVTGNAGTATTLQTARTISGVSFNGSADIDIEDRLGAAIASAATTTIGTRGLGDYIHITGTTTITSFGTAAAAGVRRTLIFDGALTLTHNATSLICPGAANIVTVAGTIIEVVAETTANWRVVSITHPSLSMAELSYLDGVTSAIQTQLNAKAALASPALTGTPTAPTAASTVSSTQIATTAFAVPRTSTTGSARLPVGTTAQRDASPVDGMIRYNSTTMGFEGYFNGQWQSVGGGQMFGNAIVKAVSYNAQTISENITVTAGLNAYSVGDITINNGYTMTIENGSVYKIL